MSWCRDPACADRGRVHHRTLVVAPRDSRALHVVLAEDGAMSTTAPPARTTRWPVARPVAGFALAGLVAVAIVGLATAPASRRVGQREAIIDARTTTLVKAQNVVEPVVSDG